MDDDDGLRTQPLDFHQVATSVPLWLTSVVIAFNAALLDVIASVTRLLFLLIQEKKIFLCSTSNGSQDRALNQIHCKNVEQREDLQNSKQKICVQNPQTQFDRLFCTLRPVINPLNVSKQVRGLDVTAWLSARHFLDQLLWPLAECQGSNHTGTYASTLAGRSILGGGLELLAVVWGDC